MPLGNGQYFVLAQDQQLLAVKLDFAARILAEQDVVAGLDRHFEAGAVFKDLSVSDGNHDAFLWLLFGGIWNDDPTLGLLGSINPSYQNPIMQRSEAHTHSPSSVKIKICGE